jgi:hypothetical protein
MAPTVRGPGPLEPSLLASEAEWRKLKIDVCLKKKWARSSNECGAAAWKEGPVAEVWKISSGDCTGC